MSAAHAQRPAGGRRLELHQHPPHAERAELPSEAAYRFSRGVHPAMAERGVRRGLELMRRWAGGSRRGAGGRLSAAAETRRSSSHRGGRDSAAGDRASSPRRSPTCCARLEFGVAGRRRAAARTRPRPPAGYRRRASIGQADLMEEIARIYGYDRIPETHMVDDRCPRSVATRRWRARSGCAICWSSLGCRK